MHSAAEQRPGFELINAPVHMVKASSASMTCTGTFERRDNLQELEAESYDELKKKLPEGWRMLNVRRL
jgi:hypothetical protein